MDLNCDLGEGYDDWEPGVEGLDTRLLAIVTSANVACGAHAGDDRAMAEVCRVAARHGVAVGAHVSYEDRADFGRTFRDVPPDELRAQVAAQIRALAAHAAAAGTRIRYVKPHGALYNALVHHDEQARAVLDGVADACADRRVADLRTAEPLPVVGLPGSAVLALAASRGVRAVGEAFADRGYRSDGTLVPRTEPGALVTDPREVERRVVQLATTGTLTAADGSQLALDAETVCVHSDTPGAATLAAGVRRALERAGVRLASFAD
ncbi:LamB/YcsF family protein [Cellulomonas composti]|uniref:UPF0271 protein n=1 Tax=Cellulomonas composti TaxID=266130 RepID=A0A511JCU2_9CELL|nr:5-oxoprolinase subunit PxpA [Cellulomonas composti]GEL95794.1 UPF0271 protein [Cellulomonas composti]